MQVTCNPLFAEENSNSYYTKFVIYKMFCNENWSCFCANANSMLNCIPSKVKSPINHLLRSFWPPRLLASTNLWNQGFPARSIWGTNHLVFKICWVAAVLFVNSWIWSSCGSVVQSILFMSFNAVETGDVTAHIMSFFSQESMHNK